MLALSRDEQRCLLELARQAMASALEGAALDLPAWSARLPSEQLRQPGAAFVTLYHHGRLRGCVGSVRPGKPLFMVVADCAVSAALHDPRFEPVAPSEAAQLKVEISILSPLVPIQPEEVKPGEHGLMITEGFRRGVLLPKTATEHGWSRERFLEETCSKAGLERDAWKKGARVEAFTALVFSEE
jgi:AmmeMemoRadiSam system protein A